MPNEVLEEVQQELLDWQGLGLSVMEISHRSPEFVEVAEQAEEALKTAVRGLQTEMRNNVKALKEGQKREKELRLELASLQGRRNDERKRQIEEEIERAKAQEQAHKMESKK